MSDGMAVGLLLVEPGFSKTRAAAGLDGGQFARFS
jgi:hypothetical protein